MSKILITGASGFVGSFLVEEALAQGLEVYAGIRKTSSKKYLVDDRIQFVYLDFEDKQNLIDNIKQHQFDYIIHNAGATSAPNREVFFKVNSTYVTSFAEIAMAYSTDLKKFTFTSSMASYGPADFTENGEVNHQQVPHPVTTYGESKLAAEKSLIGMKGLPYLIFRPTAVYGPRETEVYQVFKILNKGLVGPLIGYSPQLLTFIYVKDLSKLMVNATISGISRESYFVSDGNVYDSKTFNQIVAKALNKSIFSLKIPIWVLSLVAELSQLYTRFSGKRTVLDREKVQELKARSWKLDIEPQKRDFNYKTLYPLEKGIPETAQWYKENNWL